MASFIAPCRRSPFSINAWHWVNFWRDREYGYHRDTCFSACALSEPFTGENLSMASFRLPVETHLFDNNVLVQLDEDFLSEHLLTIFN